MFTLAIGTVPSSNVLSQGPLPRRGIAAACPGALVRPLPRVLEVALGCVPLAPNGSVLVRPTLLPWL